MMVDYRLNHHFPIAQRTLPWQPILGSKLAKSNYLLLFVVLAFQNGLQYRPSDLKKFICDDLATLYINLVNFCPITLEFKIGTPRFFLLKFSDKLSQDPPDRFL